MVAKEEEVEAKAKAVVQVRAGVGAEAVTPEATAMLGQDMSREVGQGPDHVVVLVSFPVVHPDLALLQNHQMLWTSNRLEMYFTDNI